MAVSKKARTGADFRALYDPDVIVPNKIRAALAEMRRIGPEHYLYDEEFRSLCGLQGAQLAAYRDLREFARHWFMAPGQHGRKSAKRVWWGDAKKAAKYRPRSLQVTG